MNKILKAVISFLIGLIGGIFTVYIGVGMSLMIPLVMFTNIISDFRTAVGTMFLTIFSPILIVPTYNYYKAGNLDVVVGLWMALGYFIGSYITSTYYLYSVEKEILYLLFGIYQSYFLIEQFCSLGFLLPLIL